MSANALESQGLLLKIGDGADPETFTAIPEVKEISGPSGSASIIDITDLDSTHKEKRMGLPDEGQVSFTLHYIPKNTQHAQLRTDRAARTLRNFQLLFTDDPVTTWSFAGYVTKLEVSGEVDGVVEAECEIEITGAITES
jgi:predicted secreted protein